MTLTKAQVKTQYERAKRQGWLPFFIASAEKHTRNYFDAADLMGIGSRETELDPRWLTKPGDGGNGFGLMQADKRSFAEWIKTGEWKQADKSIEMGAIVLMKKWDDVQYCVGLRCTVTSSKNGKRYTFTGKDVKGVVAQRVTIASYNAGRWAHYAVSNGQDVDAYTTGKDYSKDVMRRAAKFRELLKADGYLTAETNSAAKQQEKPVEQVNEKRDDTLNQPMTNVTSTFADDRSAVVWEVKPDETPQIQPTIPPDAEPPSIDVNVTNEPPKAAETTVTVAGPEPYRGVGFWASIKKDLIAATGGNLTFGTLNEYATQASGWPEWVVGMVKILAVGLLIATFGYFVFRVVHYAVDRWQQNERTKMIVSAASDPNKANVDFEVAK